MNKKSGSDFYPPQTTQPFAVIDSLARLGLADPDKIEVYTFDISSRVNKHLERARRDAAAGKPYTIPLRASPSDGWSNSYHEGFLEFWQKLGKQIGKSTAAIPVPEEASDIWNRAINVNPSVVRRVTPVDMMRHVLGEGFTSNGPLASAAVAFTATAAFGLGALPLVFALAAIVALTWINTPFQFSRKIASAASSPTTPRALRAIQTFRHRPGSRGILHQGWASRRASRAPARARQASRSTRHRSAVRRSFAVFSGISAKSGGQKSRCQTGANR